MGSLAASRLVASGWNRASNSRRSPSAMIWTLRTQSAFASTAVAVFWASDVGVGSVGDITSSRSSSLAGRSLPRRWAPIRLLSAAATGAPHCRQPRSSEGRVEVHWRSRGDEDRPPPCVFTRNPHEAHPVANVHAKRDLTEPVRQGTSWGELAAVSAPSRTHGARPDFRSDVYIRHPENPPIAV